MVDYKVQQTPSQPRPLGAEKPWFGFKGMASEMSQLYPTPSFGDSNK